MQTVTASPPTAHGASPGKWRLGWSAGLEMAP
jgi:hypothetical protein